ncbi:MAG: GAF domain-containing protein [Longimicrobiales bacterium]
MSSNSVPGTAQSTVPTLEPIKSRPPRWAIWLPAGLTTLLLVAAAIAFVILGRRIEGQHSAIADLLEPAGRGLVRLQLLFEAELTLLRSYAALPRPQLLPEVRSVNEKKLWILGNLVQSAPRLDRAYAIELDAFRSLLALAQIAPLALASGTLTLEQYRARLPQQDDLARQVLVRAVRLEIMISDERERRLAQLRTLENRRLRILSSLFPLALFSAFLTAWFGEKARGLNQRLVRNAAEEALLRDAMAALTHTDVLPQALERIVAVAQRVGDADSAYIEQCDDARSRVTVVAAAGADAPPVGLSEDYIDSVTDEVVRTGQSQSITDLTAMGGQIGRAIANRCGHCPGLAVPLHHDGDVDGVLILMRRRATMFERTQVPRIWVLGALAALALRRTKLAGALESERKRLEAVVAEMPAGVLLAEAPSGRIILVNRQTVEIWRGQVRPPERIEEYADWKSFHLDGRPYTSEELPLARSIRSGELVQGEEAEIERTDGSRGMVRFSSAPVRDTRGQIVAAVATIYDISEQKRREQENLFLDEVSRVLAASLDYDATLKTLLQLCVPRLATFAVLHLRTGNDRASRRFQSQPQDTSTRDVLETIDRKYPVPLTGPHPSAVAMRTGQAQLRAQVTDEVLRQIATDEEHLELLRRLEMRSAMAAPLIVRGKTLGALLLVSQDPLRRYNGKDLALAEELARRAALAVDNAELFRTVSEAEKRARFLADAAQAFSGSLDYEETIRRVVRLAVPFFADLTIAFLTDEKGETRQVAVAHRDPRREALLEKAGERYRPGPNNPGSTIVRAIRTGQPVLIEEVSPELIESIGFSPDVRIMFDRLGIVSWVTIPLIARDMALGAIVFAFAESGRHYTPDDVPLAQLLASRAALAMKNAKLYGAVHDALRTRDEVLAIVSHDLRNPLHTISMSADLLLQVPADDPKRRHHLEVIAQAGQRMKRLIQDLLDVARVEAGKTIAVERKEEPAHTLIHEACESFVEEARKKSIHLEWSAPQDLPNVSVDHGRILQVLANLISNALRFTPEDGHVQVSALLEHGQVRVSVGDSGPGIREDDRESIFLPFWQSTRAARTSAGLGLTIARAIIEQHGGSIWVDSRAGAGATFFFTLPINGNARSR